MQRYVVSIKDELELHQPVMLWMAASGINPLVIIQYIVDDLGLDIGQKVSLSDYLRILTTVMFSDDQLNQVMPFVKAITEKVNRCLGIHTTGIVMGKLHGTNLVVIVDEDFMKTTVCR